MDRAVRIVLVSLLVGACSGGGEGDDDGEAAQTTSSSSRVEMRDTVVACLPEGASSDEVEELFERVSVPHPSGTGTDLMEGIQSVSRRESGVAVEFVAGISSDVRAEVLHVLALPPVVSLEDRGTCP